MPNNSCFIKSCASTTEDDCDVDVKDEILKMLKMIKCMYTMINSLKESNSCQNKKLKSLCRRIECLENSKYSDDCCVKPAYGDCEMDDKMNCLVKMVEDKCTKLEESIERLNNVVYRRCC